MRFLKQRKCWNSRQACSFDFEPEWSHHPALFSIFSSRKAGWTETNFISVTKTPCQPGSPEEPLSITQNCSKSRHLYIQLQLHKFIIELCYKHSSLPKKPVFSLTKSGGEKRSQFQILKILKKGHCKTTGRHFQEVCLMFDAEL